MPVPLVLHGSSGVADADLTRAVEAGMTKVNIATHLNNVFTGRRANGARTTIPRWSTPASTSGRHVTRSLPRWHGCWRC